MSRITIDQIANNQLLSAGGRISVADKGHRRFRVLGFYNFDTRSRFLTDEIADNENSEYNQRNLYNRNKIIADLQSEYGKHNFDQKLRNFIDIGTAPFSIISHHNALDRQNRSAFVSGCYYSALTGSCALGERILNHLTLDLRDDFKESIFYKKLYNKNSFQDWDLMINALKDWEVLIPNVDIKLGELKKLRHESLHFNKETTEFLRQKALEAIHAISFIGENQFSSFGCQPWFIHGTRGAMFIRKSYEDNPFITKYYLSQCFYVGFRHSIEFDEMMRPCQIDFSDYGDGEISDEDYCQKFNDITEEMRAKKP